MLLDPAGTECISVVETQRITWHGRSKFTMSSEPSLNVSYAPAEVVQCTVWVHLDEAPHSALMARAPC